MRLLMGGGEPPEHDTPSRRDLYGCDTGHGIKPLDIVVGSRVATFIGCPWHYWLPRHRMEMGVWDAAMMLDKHGILPYAGGSQEQPAALMDCIRIVLNEVARIRKDRPDG